MYSRVLRSFVIINVQNLSKCVNVTRSSGVTSRINLKFIGQKCTPSLINVRLCTTMTPPDKDKIAEEYFAEYLKDPENDKKYKILQLEVDVMRQSGEMVPEEMRLRDWMELTQLATRMKRRKFLTFLFSVEKKKENNFIKKQKRLEEHLAKENVDIGVPDYLQYKLGGNSLMMRIYDSQMNDLYNWKACQSMIFGQKLVFDCGYEDKMNRIETKYCARQLQFAFAANRMLKEPFDLYFCNFGKTGYLHQELYSYLPTMYQPEFPINLTEKSYLDIFDKDKLVYLTPDCNEDLNIFNHDDIYIIGAIVDKVSGVPMSMAKAKREGLRMAKLPIDKYLDFGGGSGKSLTLNQMLSILADIKRTGDWSYALQHVPSRKLYGYRQQANQRKMEKILHEQEEAYVGSTSPQDYSLHARKKFRVK